MRSRSVLDQAQHPAVDQLSAKIHRRAVVARDRQCRRRARILDDPRARQRANAVAVPIQVQRPSDRKRRLRGKGGCRAGEERPRTHQCGSGVGVIARQGPSPRALLGHAARAADAPRIGGVGIVARCQSRAPQSNLRARQTRDGADRLGKVIQIKATIAREGDRREVGNLIGRPELQNRRARRASCIADKQPSPTRPRRIYARRLAQDEHAIIDPRRARIGIGHRPIEGQGAGPHLGQAAVHRRPADHAREGGIHEAIISRGQHGGAERDRRSPRTR